MKLHYTAFMFNNKLYGSLFNVVMSDDFYAESIRGSRSILEDKIPGRDIPYFYEVEDDVLEFDMNFAFENPMTKSEVNLIARDLLTPQGYSELSFGKYFGVSPLVAAFTSTTSQTISNNVEKIFTFNSAPTGGFIVGSRIRAYQTGTSTNYMEGVITFINGTSVTLLVNEIGGSGTGITTWSFHLVYQIKTPFYKVIFTGEPEIEYMGVNSLNPKYLVYFNLKARCDRPYGFYKVRQTLSTGTSITVNNPGELPVYAGIKFTSTPTGPVGLVATLVTGVNTVTLTTGNTSGLIPGQALTKTSGTGAFGTGPRVGAITNATQFTVVNSSGTALNHATDGAITFSAVGNYARLFDSSSNKISFTSLFGETVNINSNLKTLSSSGPSIYTRWMSDDLLFYPGNNVINFQQSTTPTFTAIYNLLLTNVEITFEAPAFIKGE